jgi:hypothetical protein
MNKNSVEFYKTVMSLMSKGWTVKRICKTFHTTPEKIRILIEKFYPTTDIRKQEERNEH